VDVRDKRPGPSGPGWAAAVEVSPTPDRADRSASVRPECPRLMPPATLGSMADKAEQAFDPLLRRPPTRTARSPSRPPGTCHSAG
jgi:hypothetical protein